MDYSKTVPCGSCPFRKGQTFLTKPRARQIAGYMDTWNGAEFACHKTTERDDDGNHCPSRKESHCAGALIFAEKNEQSHQMMRIAERLGMYDPTRLMSPDNQQAIDSVYDTKQEMVKAHDRNK